MRVYTDAIINDDGQIIEGSSTLFLVIADMCSGFDRPCVMDVKMGRTTVEPNEDEVWCVQNKQGRHCFGSFVLDMFRYEGFLLSGSFSPA